MYSVYIYFAAKQKQTIPNSFTMHQREKSIRYRICHCCFLSNQREPSNRLGISIKGCQLISLTHVFLYSNSLQIFALKYHHITKLLAIIQNSNNKGFPSSLVYSSPFHPLETCGKTNSHC